MGSVGENYVCPHCDVRGSGGYSPDTIGYPICVLGRANCLAKIDWAWTRAMVKHAALKMVFGIYCSVGDRGVHEYYANPSRWPHAILVVGAKVAEFM